MELMTFLHLLLLVCLFCASEYADSNMQFAMEPVLCLVYVIVICQNGGLEDQVRCV